MGGKRSKSERIDKFRMDAERLLKTYSRIKMAKRLEFKDSTYLGRCINGSAKPGESFLDKFYGEFGPELIESNIEDLDVPDLPGDGKQPQSGSTYQEELIAVLREHNRDLMSCVNEFGSALKNFGVTAASFQTLADSNSKLVDMQKDYIAMLKKGQPFPPDSERELPANVALEEKEAKK